MKTQLMSIVLMVVVLLSVSMAYSNQETNSFLEFNSENGYVSVPDSNELDFGINDFSISFWIYAEEIVGCQSIMFKVNANEGNGYYIYGYPNNSLGFSIYWSYWSHDSVHISTDSLILNEWNHVCFTVSRDDYTISYLNGQMCYYSESFDISDRSISNSSDLFLGKSSDLFHNSGKYKKGYKGFNGYLDDIRFYKRNLSRLAVKNLYNDGSGTEYTGCSDEGGEASVAFELDEGHGNKIYDSENGLVGRLHNKVKWIND